MHLQPLSTIEVFLNLLRKTSYFALRILVHSDTPEDHPQLSCTGKKSRAQHLYQHRRCEICVCSFPHVSPGRKHGSLPWGAEAMIRTTWLLVHTCRCCSASAITALDNSFKSTFRSRRQHNEIKLGRPSHDALVLGLWLVAASLPPLLPPSSYVQPDNPSNRRHSKAQRRASAACARISCSLGPRKCLHLRADLRSFPKLKESSCQGESEHLVRSQTSQLHSHSNVTPSLGFCWKCALNRTQKKNSNI